MLRCGWSDAHDRTSLVVTGWAAGELAALGQDTTALQRRFAVVPASTLGQDPHANTATLGTFSITGDTLVFRPRHPFAPGTTYAFLDRTVPDGAAPQLVHLPAPTTAANTVVTGIYPTTTELPMNALRFYVHFSQPMSDGLAAKSISLVDLDTGDDLTETALLAGPELWDCARTRLTLLLDPGRIKRGLRPNLETGYPLLPGQHVALVVRSRFLDATGAPLTADAQMTYRIGAPIRTRVDPRRWEVTAVAPGTRRPVRLTADRPLDHALAARCLSVRASTMRRVGGSSVLAPGDREWAFTPTVDWGSDPYWVVVEPLLEDVAGNSVVRVFDRDLTDPAHEPVPAEPIRLAAGRPRGFRGAARRSAVP